MTQANELCAVITGWPLALHNECIRSVEDSTNILAVESFKLISIWERLVYFLYDRG